MGNITVHFTLVNYIESILIKGGIIITMNERYLIYEDGAVAITDNLISAVGKTKEIEKNTGEIQLSMQKERP